MTVQLNQWFVRYDVPSVNGHVYPKGCFKEVPSEVMVVSELTDGRASLDKALGVATLQETEEGIIVTGIKLRDGAVFYPEIEAVGVVSVGTLKNNTVQPDASIRGAAACSGVDYSWWKQYPDGTERPLSSPVTPKVES